MKKKYHVSKLLSSGYLIMILLFIYLPIIYLMLFSFNEGKSTTNFSGFSLRWYENLFKDRTMLESIYVTLIVAVIATVVSTVIGTIAAIGLSKAKRLIRSRSTPRQAAIRAAAEMNAMPTIMGANPMCSRTRCAGTLSTKSEPAAKASRYCTYTLPR